MTNTPIDRIDALITALETLKSTALECESDMRESGDDPLFDCNDAMLESFSIFADDIIDASATISIDDFEALKSLIIQ